MFAKNKQQNIPAVTSSVTSSTVGAGSLRLRLIFWYGGLLASALIIFIVLIWNLTADALGRSLDGVVEAETRTVGVSLNHQLTSTSPYWSPTPLKLQSVNDSQDLDTIVIVIDKQGHVRYNSLGTTTAGMLTDVNVVNKTLGERTIWSTVTFDGDLVRMKAMPVRAPGPGNYQSTSVTTNNGPVIGTMVVAKSLESVGSTLQFLGALLVSIGAVILVITLLGGWVIAGYVLQPLRDIIRTARTIALESAHGTQIGNLSRRARRSESYDEMAQVVDTFNEMLANLEKAMWAQRRFVNDASHELRAPLTIVQGNMAFLMRHSDELSTEDRHTMLLDTHAETLRLARLVDDLLILARADAQDSLGQQKLSSGEAQSEEQISLQPLIELDRVILQLVRQFRRRLQIEQEQVDLVVGHIEPVRVRGNEESIRRILLILLDNALKYTSGDTQQEMHRVTVFLERSGEEAVVSVRDTGIGIDAQDLPHIFERFYRADRARSRRGTGLGLAIAQTLAAQLHGRLTVESAPGQGSTFSIRLPFGKDV
jgi:signal transduction histidine kinase